MPMPLVAVNPEVEEIGEYVEIAEEGCLSFPGIFAEVERSEIVKMKYFDTKGIPHELVCEGLFARCVQHEFDHLNGICFIDRLKPRQLFKIEPKLKKLRRETRDFLKAQKAAHQAVASTPRPRYRKNAGNGRTARTACAEKKRTQKTRSPHGRNPNKNAFRNKNNGNYNSIDGRNGLREIGGGAGFRRTRCGSARRRQTRARRSRKQPRSGRGGQTRGRRTRIRSRRQTNRAEIAKAVFSDAAKLAKIERAIHPAIEREWRAAAEKLPDGKIAVVEVPLLFEKKLEKKFDFCITVFCSEPLRKFRLSNRGMSDEQIARRDAFQMPPEQKSKLADIVLFNESDTAFLKRQAELVLSRLNKNP